eukprot:366485-Chlamydomonas_euryale.AAC.1
MRGEGGRGGKEGGTEGGAEVEAGRTALAGLRPQVWQASACCPAAITCSVRKGSISDKTREARHAPIKTSCCPSLPLRCMA